MSYLEGSNPRFPAEVSAPEYVGICGMINQAGNLLLNTAASFTNLNIILTQNGIIIVTST